MPRGPKLHLKRLNAPHHWLLDKVSGRFAPKPSPGPHKSRECIPLIVFIRNRLKYALTGQEVKLICMQRLIKVDGKVRTDTNYPAGFMDVVSLERSNEHFRMMFDTKGRFTVHRITPEEARYKLCKVKAVRVGAKSVPCVTLHDGRTIRYPDPLAKVADSVKVDLETNTVTDVIKFDTGSLVMITGGHNIGRVGTVVQKERHPGSFDIVHVKDSAGRSFATRSGNVFVIGKGSKALVSLPKTKGVRLTIAQERDRRFAKASA